MPQRIRWYPTGRRRNGRKRNGTDWKNHTGFNTLSRWGFILRRQGGGRASFHREGLCTGGVPADYRRKEKLAHSVSFIPSQGKHCGLDSHEAHGKGAGGGKRLRRHYGRSFPESGGGDLCGPFQKTEHDKCLPPCGMWKCDYPCGQFQGHWTGFAGQFRLYFSDRRVWVRTELHGK